jgi:hypothetical protein
MTTEMALRCRCGKVRGVAHVGPATGNRVVCYCDDCQAFARFVGAQGVLDPAGGTDVFQMAPADLRVTEGLEELRCVRLSDKGMFRWYAGCCKTPIGNTVGPRFPFIGVIHAFMDHAGDGRSRDEVLGPVRGYLYLREAVGSLPPHARESSMRVIARVLRLALGWWLRGKGKPSVFFDPRTGRPRAEPQVLRADERGALKAA